MVNWFNAIPDSGVAPQRSDTPSAIHFTMNDPTTPALVGDVPVPTAPPAPAFTVLGYQGGGQAAGSPGAQAAQVYAAIVSTINGVNATADKPLGWAATSNLVVRPRAGRKFNAYYDRKSLNFFFDRDPILGHDVYAADSHDIVSHETGHAILDFYAPWLWNFASVEAWAFHEAFADTIAFLSVLTHDEVLQFLLSSTGGNLRRDSPISRIGEQFGQAMYHAKESGKTQAGWVRNVWNNYKYIDPVALPDSGSDDQLTSDPHNFSRIISGAYYETLVTIYEMNMAGGQEAFAALRNARNTLSSYLIRSVQRMPMRTKVYSTAAEALLAVDAEANTPYQLAIRSVFVMRNIVPMVKMLAEMPPKPARVVKLSEALPIRATTNNPLYDVHLEIPDDGVDSLLAAHDLARYLHEKELVGPSHDTPFELSDGKLIRSHIACGCSGDDHSPFGNKYQPEYQRPYKPENNAGCCCGCRSKPKESVNPQPKKIGCVIRYRLTR